jgi:uncharacterized protein (DUF4415 family)
MTDNEIPIITRDRILTAQTAAERRAARPGKSDKTQVKISLDNDIIEWLKSSGRGYQNRLNQLLKSIMELSKKTANDRSR